MPTPDRTAPEAVADGGVSVEVSRHALDRVPISLIIDDSTPLLNLNYFFLRDRIRHTGNFQRWEDVPVVIPETFTREFGQWCLEHGVRGKFSVVPCPAGVGRIDRGLPPFSQHQLEGWLEMCREVIAPGFDITPEMLTHTFVLDLQTLQPLPSRIWEQYEWATFGEEDAAGVADYIALACQILANVGLPPQGVTSPGGFGGRVLPLYARLTGEAVRRVTGNPTPYFFQRVVADGRTETPVWYADRQQGTAVGEVIAATDDWTGSWTGYGEADADRYLTADLLRGRLPAVIDAGDPCVLVSHWQGFYGMHNGDRRGFRTLQTVVERLRALDPHGERTQWRRTSEITTYACARELASVTLRAGTVDTAETAAVTDQASDDARVPVVIGLDLPVRVPDLTLRVSSDPSRPPLHVREVRCDHRPLRRVTEKRALCSGTFLEDGTGVLLAYDPADRRSTVELLLA